MLTNLYQLQLFGEHPCWSSFPFDWAAMLYHAAAAVAVHCVLSITYLLLLALLIVKNTFCWHYIYVEHITRRQLYS